MGTRFHGAVAGAIGGLAGTLVMNYVQRAWTLVSDGSPPASAAAHHDARDWQERSERQNSNELAAQTLARGLVRRELSRRELSIAAPLLHFSFGAAVGAVHGLQAGTARPGPWTGITLGALLWLSADEIAMPAVGLSRSTWRRPLEMHAQSLAAHLAYGVVAEQVRYVVRAVLRTTRPIAVGAGR